MHRGQIIRLLGEFGKISRWYFVTDDKSTNGKRGKKNNKNVRYIEGWVEFVNKHDAKVCVAQLNNRQVGGKKMGKFHDCIWNMKYLKQFKWPQLQEMLSYERHLRADKLKEEFAHIRKQDDMYLENVEKSKKHLKAEESRAMKKKKKEENEKKEKMEKKD
jgi:ESF2/ABP1 family protein